jgi:hypothetical protein
VPMGEQQVARHQHLGAFSSSSCGSLHNQQRGQPHSCTAGAPTAGALQGHVKVPQAQHILLEAPADQHSKERQRRGRAFKLACSHNTARGVSSQRDSTGRTAM